MGRRNPGLRKMLRWMAAGTHRRVFIDQLTPGHTRIRVVLKHRDGRTLRHVHFVPRAEEDKLDTRIGRAITEWEVKHGTPPTTPEPQPPEAPDDDN